MCFANKNKNCQLSCSCFQTSQTGGQWYNDTSPFSIPWYRHHLPLSLTIVQIFYNRSHIMSQQKHFVVTLAFRGIHLQLDVFANSGNKLLRLFVLVSVQKITCLLFRKLFFNKNKTFIICLLSFFSLPSPVTGFEPSIIGLLVQCSASVLSMSVFASIILSAFARVFQFLFIYLPVFQSLCLFVSRSLFLSERPGSILVKCLTVSPHNSLSPGLTHKY